MNGIVTTRTSSKRVDYRINKHVVSNSMMKNKYFKQAP